MIFDYVLAFARCVGKQYRQWKRWRNGDEPRITLQELASMPDSEIRDIQAMRTVRDARAELVGRGLRFTILEPR